MSNYQHDCPSCKPIQTIVRSDGREIDWYYCRNSDVLGGTILGRFGDEGPEYWSMPLDVLKTNLSLANSSQVSEMFNQCVAIYQVLRRRKEIE